jgi:hypothetical protein
MDEQRKQERKQAIVIAAAIFAARDLAQDWNGGRSPRAIAGRSQRDRQSPIPSRRHRAQTSVTVFAVPLGLISGGPQGPRNVATAYES